MKSFVICCLFFCLTCYGVFVSSASGENQRKSDHISAGKILEFSLQNLKESLIKAMQQNDLLKFENETLQRDVQSLVRIRENLIVKKSSLSGGSPSLDHQSAPTPSVELSDIQGRKRKAQDLIAIFERDIMVLKEKIQILNGKLDEKKYRLDKQQLLERKQAGEKKLSKAQNRLDYFDKKADAPLRAIEALKEEKRSLEYQIEMLEDTPH